MFAVRRTSTNIAKEKTSNWPRRSQAAATKRKMKEINEDGEAKAEKKKK